ncbi:MAG TPA: DUF2905 domain-containing protein [Pyrinomonadaceae bacterium]|jgi:hypothetical protein
MGFGASWWFVLAGVGLAVLGLLALKGRLSGFGRLPGDIRYSGRGTRVYAPLTSMLLLSVVLSLLLSLLSWLFG